MNAFVPHGGPQGTGMSAAQGGREYSSALPRWKALGIGHLQGRTMLITREWLEAHKTKDGGWTRQFLTSIGVSWPPKSGWAQEVIGRQLSERGH